MSALHTEMRHRSVVVDGLDIFYREAGPQDAPVILLLHGFPSSSRMYTTLMPRLADTYRLIAPDYPGFGHSSAPPPDQFAYTFDHLADVMTHFVEALELGDYALFVQDYGGPVGFRLAQRWPERVRALIVQNAVAHEEGLGPLWNTRKAFWRDRATYEPALRANLLSFEATRLRHVGHSPNPERYDPDSWTDEFSFLTRPGQIDIQTELFYDYRTNVERYPQWQRFLREHRPPTLVLWGQYDPSFAVEGAHAYGQDVPDAEIHLLEGGHFVLDEANDEAAALTRRFLAARWAPAI
ncbi:Cis-3-alkyl-4-alkyloxetan-2-one decarboxylase [Paraburkholderia caffeinitolerans]|uniref:Cis-3-alkyl-4-alkyloxetan-2-one decarboxylase n=1 Tax=Paraburkholderia caffeinitolerans TaxID=1723730 RepID=A0A6J5FDV4_9BURK|nr:MULTISPECIES: alpha/beta hydrolase [Paraburkholderia]CAB3777458.1 Cis-3-alkyl-4-alkyloxetan-2-one decarboxylase [Paraburkholderia caffeinitolerans]